MRRIAPAHGAPPTVIKSGPEEMPTFTFLDGVPADDAGRADGFARGGVVLRKKERDWRGVTRTRPNVDTADGWLRGQSGEMHPFFDRRGGGKLPRVTATRRVGHEKD
jgi:hypothetical protein